MKLRLVLFVLLVSCSLFAQVALAKTITLEWKPIPAAAKYEIMISKGDKPIFKKVLAETKWSGSIKPGLMTYQIRAMDRTGRPGLWSEARALVISPEPPKIISPENGQSLTFNSLDNPIDLKWQPADGVQKYILEITKPDGEKPEIITVTETKYTLNHVTDGKYAWSVTPVFEASAQFPEKLRGKKWETSAKAQADFSIGFKKLASPDLIEPKGMKPPPKDGKLKFSWRPVQGAKAYAVEVINRTTQTSVIKFTTDKTAVMVPIKNEGEYEWKVSALTVAPLIRDLASIHPSSFGDTSNMDFRIDKSALHADGFGYVALSSMFAPYTYKMISPSTGFAGSTNSYAVTGRVSGEYWPGSSNFGASFGMENTYFTINNVNYSRLQFEGHLKYRMALSRDRFGWFVSPKIGFEYRQNQKFTPVFDGDGNVTSITNFPLWTLGPSIGVDIRKQFSETWSAGIKAAYFQPLTLSGGPAGATLGGPANNRNMGVGAQALHWVDKKWGAGFGAFYELRSVGYSGGATGSTQFEEVYMDATYFFGSIIYSFGR